MKEAPYLYLYDLTDYVRRLEQAVCSTRSIRTSVSTAYTTQCLVLYLFDRAYGVELLGLPSDVLLIGRQVYECLVIEKVLDTQPVLELLELLRLVFKQPTERLTVKLTPSSVLAVTNLSFRTHWDYEYIPQEWKVKNG